MMPSDQLVLGNGQRATGNGQPPRVVALIYSPSSKSAVAWRSIANWSRRFTFPNAPRKSDQFSPIIPDQLVQEPHCQTVDQLVRPPRSPRKPALLPKLPTWGTVEWGVVKSLISMA